MNDTGVTLSVGQFWVSRRGGRVARIAKMTDVAGHVLVQYVTGDGTKRCANLRNFLAAYRWEKR